MKVAGLCGWSGSGKTTLMARLIPAFRVRGLSVSTIKHAHHGFDVDRPGKDSHVHREAGASEVLVASARRWALIHELRDEAEPSLADLLARMSPVDLVLVEGFKRDIHPKVEVHRVALCKPLLQPDDAFITAVASDTGLDVQVPVLDLNDLDMIVDHLLRTAVPIGTLRARVSPDDL